MKRTPLDYYDYIPSAQRAYLRANGWHFNKKACDFAVSLMMKDVNDKEEPLDAWTKEQVDDLLHRYGIRLVADNGYDSVYVANMARADYYKKSVPDEAHLAMFVKDTIDDIDSADGNIMRKWLATMVGNGVSVRWEDFL